MIADDIKNILKYKSLIPDDVIDFLNNLSVNIKEGRYDLVNGRFANVDVYYTKEHALCKLEAHKKYIDIQVLLEGYERLDYTETDGLFVSEDYDENRDVMFFKHPEKVLNTCVLEPLKFIMLYPYEAHMPQMNLGSKSSKVKKVVVKIPV